MQKLESRWLILGSVGLILLLIGAFSIKQNEVPAAPAFAYNNLIRFHVIANSDSEIDQTVKLQVRDRVLEDLGPLLNQAQSIEEARSVVRENVSQIQNLAQKEVEDCGMNYPVWAEIGQFEFPTRSYGKVILPAGSYEALRISLGQEEGQNWWCVLFPPLCFVNGSGGPVLGDFQQFEEMEPLSPVFAPSVLQSNEEPKIRFKLWEWWAD